MKAQGGELFYDNRVGPEDSLRRFLRTDALPNPEFAYSL